MRTVNIWGLGYLHNVLPEFVERLRDDGHPEVADEYQRQADEAQEFHEHIVVLGRYEHGPNVAWEGKGVRLANKLLEMGWTPPACIPTREVKEPF